MKTLVKYMIIPLLFALSSCGPVESKQPPQTCDNCLPQEKTTTLKGSFVSGHLGNYQDCPGEAYIEPELNTDSDGAFADDCAEGQECGGLLNCEKASTTLRLSNGGDVEALGVLVQKIELKNSVGKTVAFLPLESVSVVETNAQFGGKVGVDDNISIRVDFQGPANPYQLLKPAASADAGRVSSDSTGVLHITISADNAKDITIISTPISAIPSVDT